MIRQIRSNCDLLEQMVNDLRPEKEWLSTAEFAQKTGLTLKTVSTYCGQGKFGRIRKNGRGHWEIHKSELTNN
jgi:hypothetical protein